MMAPLKSESGFSLLEVMVALAIVSIALVVMLGVANRNTLSHNRLQMMTRATFLAKQKMAELENGIESGYQRDEGSFEDPYQEFSWRISTTRSLVTDVDQLDLVVIWGEEADNEMVTLTTFVRSR